MSVFCLEHSNGLSALNQKTKKKIMKIDPLLKGLLLIESSHKGYWDRYFPNQKRAYQRHIFGRLPLPEGVSLLNEDLLIRESTGGNNHSRTVVVPKGTQVAYYPTKGQLANLLFTDTL